MDTMPVVLVGWCVVLFSSAAWLNQVVLRWSGSAKARSGLRMMPTLLLPLGHGALRVLPRFRFPSFLTCLPLGLRGDRNRLVPVVRPRHRPSPCYERLGSPDCPAIRFTQGRLFGASLVRFCCGLSGCSPPVQI